MPTQPESRDAARVYECPHVRPWTIKWGIASDAKWCPACKTFVYARLDMDGHP